MFWKPYVGCISCDKIENALCFRPLRLRCTILKQKTFAKTLALGARACFHPNTPTTRKTENHIDPSHTQMTPRKGSHKNAAQKPTQTNEQPTHEVEEATWGQSNEEKTIPRWRRVFQRNKAEPPKEPTCRKTQNKKSTNREDNEFKECREKRQVGLKEGSFPNTKTTKQQQRSNNESLTPLNHLQQHSTITCSVDERHPPETK